MTHIHRPFCLPRGGRASNLCHQGKLNDSQGAGRLRRRAGLQSRLPASRLFGPGTSRFRHRLANAILLAALSVAGLGCLLPLPALAADEPPDFLWVKTAGGSGDNLGEAIATDAVGNLYVVGSFTNSIAL